MTFEYNGTKYKVSEDSTYKEIIIPADTLDAACKMFNAVANMTAYKFNLISYSGMVVLRKQITSDDSGITVKLVLREQTDLEKANSELSDVYSAVQEMNLSEDEAAAHPCLFPEIGKVDKVIPGNYYRVNGEVRLITAVIDEDAEGQFVSRPLTRSK